MQGRHPYEGVVNVEVCCLCCISYNNGVIHIDRTVLQGPPVSRLDVPPDRCVLHTLEVRDLQHL